MWGEKKRKRKNQNKLVHMTPKERKYVFCYFSVVLSKSEVSFGGGDGRNFEPKARLKFENLDKSIQKLRAIYKVHSEWFKTPKHKSNKGQNVVDYSI